MANNVNLSECYDLREFVNQLGGIGNVRLFVKMSPIETYIPFMGLCMTNGDPDKATWAECYLDESRYSLEDGYKITVRAIDQRFSYEDFYQSDLMSSIRQGYVLVKTSMGQHVEHISWAEPLCGSAYVVHEADIVTE